MSKKKAKKNINLLVQALRPVIDEVVEQAIKPLRAEIEALRRTRTRRDRLEGRMDGFKGTGLSAGKIGRDPCREVRVAAERFRDSVEYEPQTKRERKAQIRQEFETWDYLESVPQENLTN